MPSATVLSVALAGALACSKVRRVRLAAAAVGARRARHDDRRVHDVPRSIRNRSVSCRAPAPQ